jgi:hypothetical protein
MSGQGRDFRISFPVSQKLTLVTMQKTGKMGSQLPFAAASTKVRNNPQPNKKPTPHTPPDHLLGQPRGVNFYGDTSTGKRS